MLLIVEGLLFILIGFALLVLTVAIPHSILLILALSQFRWMSFDEVVECSETPRWIARLCLVGLQTSDVLEIRPTQACIDAVVADMRYDPANADEMRLAQTHAILRFWFTTAHQYEYRLLSPRPRHMEQTDQEGLDLFGALV